MALARNALPSLYRVAAEPTSAIHPLNSCPTTIGTGTVRAAHSSQFQICTSVPQIALFATLISTSAGPGSGTATRSIHSPGSGRDLTSAFIILVIGSLPVSGWSIGGSHERRASSMASAS